MEKDISKAKKYMLISIIMIVMIITVIIVVLLNNRKSSDEEYEKEEYPSESAINEDVDKIDATKFNDLEDGNLFFRVEDCIKLYYEYLNIKDYEEEKEYIPGMEESIANTNGIYSEEDKIQAIINLLSKKFIGEKSITKKNLYDFVQPIDLDKYQIQISEVKVYTNEDVRNYYAVGKVIDRESYQIVKDIYFIVNLNVEDDCFSIYPLDEKPKDLEKFINNDKIEENKNNTISITTITDREKIIKYFSNFKMNAINKTDYAFKLLDEEYRKKRFDNDKEKFDKYIDSNVQELIPIVIKKYLVKDNEKYKEYVCKDEYENLYVFKEIGIMKYTVELDTYTIESEEFKQAYESATEQDKVAMNIDKWVSMINNRDYQAAYNVLDETFREDNFGDVEGFEEYMKQQYPLHYSVEQGEINKESNAYVRDVVLKDITGEEDSEEETNIIMQLKEGTDFVMSFYVRRH